MACRSRSGAFRVSKRPARRSGGQHKPGLGLQEPVIPVTDASLDGFRNVVNGLYQDAIFGAARRPSMVTKIRRVQQQGSIASSRCHGLM